VLAHARDLNIRPRPLAFVRKLVHHTLQLADSYRVIVDVARALDPSSPPTHEALSRMLSAATRNYHSLCGNIIDGGSAAAAPGIQDVQMSMPLSSNVPVQTATSFASHPAPMAISVPVIPVGITLPAPPQLPHSQVRLCTFLTVLFS
jgi:hypothetical protein